MARCESWNVKGLNNVVKRRKILFFIKAKKCHIVFIQEPHLSLLCVNSKSRGVATLIDRRLQMFLMLCEIQGKKFILANVYAPNVDDPSFFGQLEKKLMDLGNYPIIAAGDFNEVMDMTLDRSANQSHPVLSHIKWLWKKIANFF
uniref:Endonuclease/exonuclease/phosphatase domain-containing protein n=1 Tax=Kryptolebias marmoratus TaxID=37003 RepID=A0A3Q2ZBS8_KRYMA